MAFNLRKIPKTQWLMGCSVAVVGFCITFGFLAYQSLKTFRNHFLVDQSDQLPVLTATPAETAALIARFDQFAATVRAGEARAEIALSRDELNQLISSHPTMAERQNRLYIKAITPDEMIVSLNLPLESLDMPEERLKGRYLTGDAHLVIGMHKPKDAAREEPQFFYIKLTKGEEEASEIFTASLGQMLSLRDWRENNPEVNAVCSRIRVLTLSQDQIHMVVDPGPTTLPMPKDED